MSTYTKVTILLRDSPKQIDYNKRIIEYLSDRITSINDNKFTIGITIIDNSNLNDYIKKGVESIPALLLTPNDPYIYGVNSILSMLAKLEIIQHDSKEDSKKDDFKESNKTTSDEGDINSFYAMALAEMKSGEEDDHETASSVKPHLQDLAETPLTDKMIEEKRKAYDSIYESRKNKNGKAPPKAKSSNSNKNTSVNLDTITDGYTDAERMLMEQIAQNI